MSSSLYIDSNGIRKGSSTVLSTNNYALVFDSNGIHGKGSSQNNFEMKLSSPSPLLVSGDSIKTQTTQNNITLVENSDIAQTPGIVFTSSGSLGGLAPLPPQNISVSSGDQKDSVDVSFSDPLSNSGSDVFSYKVYAYLVENPEVQVKTVVGTSSPINVSDLTPGSNYYFKVSSFNNASYNNGNGLESQKSASSDSIRIKSVSLSSISLYQTTYRANDTVGFTVSTVSTVSESVVINLSTNKPEAFSYFPSTCTIDAGSSYVEVYVATLGQTLYSDVYITASLDIVSINTETFEMIPSSINWVGFNMDYYFPSANAILEIYTDSPSTVDMLVDLSITNSSFFTNLPQTVTIVAGETYISIPLLVSSSISPEEGITLTASTTLLSLYSESTSYNIGYTLSGKYQLAIMENNDLSKKSIYFYRTSDYGSNWVQSLYTTDNNLYHFGEVAGVYMTIIKRNIATTISTLLRSSNSGLSFSTVSLPSGVNIAAGWLCKNISLSSDGKNQCLTLFGYPSATITYSNNYGVDWSYFRTRDTNIYDDFAVSAVSPDGMYMASIITNQQSIMATLYYSNDSGASWQSASVTSSKYQYSTIKKLYIDNDGFVLINYESFIMGGYPGSGIGQYLDSVGTFAATPSSRFMMYVNESDNKLYRTSDYGWTWDIVSTFTSRGGKNVVMDGLINSMSMSKSGKYVTIGSTGGSVSSNSSSRPSVYVSKNYGVSFAVWTNSGIFTSEPVDSYAVVSM